MFLSILIGVVSWWLLLWDLPFSPPHSCTHTNKHAKLQMILPFIEVSLLLYSCGHLHNPTLLPLPALYSCESLTPHSSNTLRATYLP